jgi:dipeptidyl-peptidase 4
MSILFILLFCIEFLFSDKLTIEQAVLNSPFKIASLGNITMIPNQDAYVIRGEGENWNQWFKVSIPDMDTTLFLNENCFNYKGSDLFVEKLILSEDGEIILVKTDVERLWRYSNIGTYFIYNIKSKLLIPLTKNNSKLRNVKFSPNGNFIAYIRNDNNLYVYNIRKSREKKLTITGSKTISNGHFGWLYEEELTGYDGYRWSPDSKSIAYWEEDESMVPEFYLLNKMNKYPLIKKIRYPKVGENNPSLRIGVVRVSGAGRKWLQNGKVTNNDYLPWMKWVNKDKVAFIKMNRKQNKMDMYISDRETGKAFHTLSEVDSSGWIDNHGHIYFLKNGMIIHLSEKSGFKHIWLTKHSGSNSWPITKGNWEVKSILYIDEVNESVYFMANKRSIYEDKLFSINFDGSDLKCLTRETGNHKIKILGSKKYFFDTYSSFNEPKIIILKKLKNGEKISTIHKTKKEQYLKYDWVKPEIVEFPTLDKKNTLTGVLILPSNFDQNKKYPVIVYGYGMPGTQSVWNQWGSTWNQFLVQSGYVVFYMDSRGMGGRGEKFKNYSYGDMSKYLSEDHLAGLGYLIKNWSIDPKRVGAWGWSGGGYFTCLMLTRNGEHFKAGVAVAPVTDYKLYDTAYTERSMGLLKENQSGYDSTNTLNWINKMKGSLLLIHGENDDNVHAQNTSQFVDKAMKYGKDIDWIQYPGRNHGIYGNGSREHLYKKMIDFFKLKL